MTSSSNKIIFIAELIGTFGLVVGATGSIAVSYTHLTLPTKA